MSKVLYLWGLQVVMKFKPVAANGKYDEICVSAGPFDDFQSVREWHSTFLDHFLEELKREPKIAECTIPSSKVGSFNPIDPMVIDPRDPSVFAHDVLCLLATLPSLVLEDDSRGPFVWIENVRMRLAEGSTPYVATLVRQGFASQKEIPDWREAFVKSFQQQAFHANVLAFRFRGQQVIPQHEHALALKDYLLDADEDPIRQGKVFFGLCCGTRLRLAKPSANRPEGDIRPGLFYLQNKAIQC